MHYLCCSYYTSVITQIEKQFGLSSAVTGFIKNIDNIGYMSTVLLVAHFCRYSNKPRLFTIAIIGSSASIFLFAVPYFIYGSGDLSRMGTGSLNGSLADERTEGESFEFCGDNDAALDTGSCRSRSYLGSFNAGALAIFIVSELLQGVAMSPKLTLSITYMDDNAKNNSPKYFGKWLLSVHHRGNIVFVPPSHTIVTTLRPRRPKQSARSRHGCRKSVKPPSV